jgi:hypothetical protein
MTTFTHPDRASHPPHPSAAASDATAVDGWLARRLPLLFRRAGLVDIRARGFFPLETDMQSFYANMADRCAEVAVKTGVITEFESRTWLDAFHEQGAQGPIVAAACTSSSRAASRYETIGHRGALLAPTT